MPDPDTERDPLEELAADFIERQRRGESPSVEEYAERHPELAADIRDLFPTIAATEAMKARRDETPDGLASLGGAPLERLGDSRIVREIGRGGMGIVYEAEQESLGRRVAIKVLPRQSLLDARHLKRFQREARIAASLHHTNVVEVFGVGEQDGFHYYVMQCIEGVGLDAIVERLARLARGSCAGGPEADATARIARRLLGAETAAEPPRLGPRYWRSVASIGLQVASALHYAHTHHTLHRDIKPANLLVDDQATVWVTDFGLAKALQSENVTMTGDIAGTLRYMAPEQFSGQTDERTDVYSLGLSLYELLALRPAFDDTDRTRLIRRIAHEAPTPLRRVDPRIPRDLETIVLKATARDPGHRYPSAEALAADLQCFLEDRPIRARRASSVERLGRWCRRNPAVAGLAATSLLLLVAIAVVATAGYVRTRAALRGEARERTKAEQERAKAEANAALAVEALDRLFARFAPSRISVSPELAVEGVEGGSVSVPTSPVLSREAAALLEEMLAFYDRLADQAGDSSRLRRKAAEANRRVGDIRQLLGQSGQAGAAYRRAIDLYEGLRRRAPEDVALVTEVAAMHNEVGRLQRSERRFAEARQSHLQALALLEAASPPLAETRYELARTHYLLATRGQQAPGIEPRGPEGGPPPKGGPERRPREGGPRRPFARFPERPGRPPGPDPDESRKEARGHLAKAIAVLKELVEEHPAEPRYRHLLALCYLESPPGRRSAETGSESEAIQILEGLVEAFPEVADYRYDLSEAYARVHIPPRRPAPGEGPPPQGPPPEGSAGEQLKKALALSEKLVAEHPYIPQYTASQARILHRLGSLYRQTGRHDEAERSYRKAVALQAPLAAQSPKSAEDTIWLGAFQNSLADVLARRGEPREARSLLEGTVKALEGLFESDPGLWFVHGMLARTQSSLAAVLRHAGEKELAAEAERQAEEHLKTLRQRMGRGPAE